MFNKTRPILIKFGMYIVPSKLAIRQCKRFPPHLNNVFTLNLCNLAFAFCKYGWQFKL